MAGSGELLAGIDPRVVDMPQSTTPKDVMQIYAVTRSSYLVAKPDASQAHGSLSNARSLMNGEWLIPRPWGEGGGVASQAVIAIGIESS